MIRSATKSTPRRQPAPAAGIVEVSSLGNLSAAADGTIQIVDATNAANDYVYTTNINGFGVNQPLPSDVVRRGLTLVPGPGGGNHRAILCPGANGDAAAIITNEERGWSDNSTAGATISDAVVDGKNVIKLESPSGNTGIALAEFDIDLTGPAPLFVVLQASCPTYNAADSRKYGAVFSVTDQYQRYLSFCAGSAETLQTSGTYALLTGRGHIAQTAFETIYGRMTWETEGAGNSPTKSNDNEIYYKAATGPDTLGDETSCEQASTNRLTNGTSRKLRIWAQADSAYTTTLYIHNLWVFTF